MRDYLFLGDEKNSESFPCFSGESVTVASLKIHGHLASLAAIDSIQMSKGKVMDTLLLGAGLLVALLIFGGVSVYKMAQHYHAIGRWA